MGGIVLRACRLRLVAPLADAHADARSWSQSELLSAPWLRVALLRLRSAFRRPALTSGNQNWRKLMPKSRMHNLMKSGGLRFATFVQFLPHVQTL
jgi:hypothetical protein